MGLGEVKGKPRVPECPVYTVFTVMPNLLIVTH